MTRTNPLPSDLPHDSFRTADALVAGASPGRLRARHLNRSVWGVRAAATAPAPDFATTCRLFLARMPSAFVSHSSAARMLGLPLPAPLEASPTIEVSVRHPDRAPHAKGLRGHALTIDDGDLTHIEGLSCTDARRTWFDLGAILAVPDLVAIGDAIISRRLTTPSELQRYLGARPGARGVSRLRTAAAMLSMRAESPQESRLRAMLMTAGFPEPSVNHDVVVAGAVIARVDLAYVDRRIAIEYQGDYHRDRTQWRADLTRRVRLEHADWTVIEVGADDLTTPAPLLSRLGRLLAL